MNDRSDFWISAVFVLAAALIVCATPSFAKSLEEKTQVCAGCHGVDGKPVDKTIPTIWGQQAGYIYIELRDFKRGDRKSDIMQWIASSFERQDMLDIAEYFSKKPWPDLGQPSAPKDVATRAVTASQSIGCTGCHLDHFQGDGSTARLAGQQHDYLIKTTTDFRNRTRGNNPDMSDLMNAASPLAGMQIDQYLGQGR